MYITQHRFYNPSLYIICKYTSDNSTFMKNQNITNICCWIRILHVITTLLNKYNSTYIIQHGFI